MRNSKTTRFYVSLIYALLLCISLQAQHFSNQKFKSYSTRVGLSSNNQSCIVQDNEGFLWVGTNDGLNRFDGQTFKVYRKVLHQPSSLQSNVILSLCVDHEGTLWVGTSRGGLSRYNKEEDNFTHFRSDFYDSTTLASDIVTSITSDHSQQLWVGTYEGLTLLKKNTNQIKRYTYNPVDTNKSGGLAYNQISTLTLDDNTLWIGYYAGTLSALDLTTNKFHHYNLFDVASRNIKEFFVTSICVKDDIVWISTWGKGIWLFNKKLHTCEPYEKTKYQFSNCIVKDNHNNLWIGTESDGIVVLQKDSVANTFKHDDLDSYSLSTNCIGSIFQDSQENIWLGNKRGNLHYLTTNNPFRVWRRNPSNTNGLLKDDVSSVLEDQHQRLWVGYAEGGLEIFDLTGKRKKITITDEGGLNGGTITSIFESHDGTIWVGTFMGGLKKYNEQNGKLISYKHNPADSTSISCNHVRQITEDSKGNLWLALHGGGLSQFDTRLEKFNHYRVNYRDTKHTINSDWLLSILCTGNDVWVGSVSGISVLHTKSNTITHYRNNPANDNSLSNENVNTIFKDSQGFIWVGTNDGLNKVDNAGNFIKIYTTLNGLPHNTIKGILEDEHHNLWISTNHGLSRLNRKTDSFKNYFSEDGLETDEFLVSSCFKNKQGEMYFAGMNGLNLFHPDSLQETDFTPPVYIIDFKLFNESVPVQSKTNKELSFSRQVRFTDNITLEYDQNIFGFDFIALDYKNLHKIQYAYKMEGFDKGWTFVGSKHEANYTNLHPGDYTFHVKASNDNGIWSEASNSIHIIVKPPLWKTGWAYSLYILLIALFLYGFWLLVFRHASMVQKLKMEELEIIKLQKMDIQKTDFFSNISHEFRTPLTLIIGPLENLMKSVRDEFKTQQLQIIHRNANRMLRLINQLMDFSKLEKDGLKLQQTYFDISAFTSVVSLSFMTEARQRNIDFNVTTPSEKLPGWFDRDKIEKILFNIIGNAFKFTPDSGQISISVSSHQYKNEDAVKITITDSGLGIAPESITKIFDRFYQVENNLNSHGSGIGLALARELATLHHGEINVESELGLGSRFYIIIPLKKYSPDSLTLTDSYKESKYDLKLHTNEKTINDSYHENISTADDKPHLLIIDDNADMRLFILHEFKDSYRISEASDGVVGFEKACAEIPDIILCDVMMPHVDGITLCRKIKLHVNTSHIPVILLTARSSDNHALEGLSSGANDYISKPFSISILKAKIKNLIALQLEIANRFVKQPLASVQEISPTSVDEKFLQKAYEVIEKNLGNQDLDVDTFSSAIGMSRAQLYRKIQMLSGQSVKEFIRIIRLKKAAEILTKGELNISQVAFDVGFSSVAYFTKSFSAYFGVTPSKYISEHKSKKETNQSFKNT